jgi:starch phosphorylase
MVLEASGNIASTVASLRESVRHHVRYSLAKEWQNLPRHDLFMAAALAVRDQLVDRMLQTEGRYRIRDPKRVYYFSIEFLIGRSLTNNLCNLGILDLWRQALRALEVDPDDVQTSERDAALGNGGLGRLAACFLDSLATLNMPGCGYGINYEYGLFKQEIDDGYQKERPDKWLEAATPWEIERADEGCVVPVYGRIEHGVDRHGHYNPMWMDWKVLIGVPYDMPVVGYGGGTVNVLRLYAARSSRDFDIQIFNEGDYLKAVEQKVASETVSKVLYPSDTVTAGQELRLVQEYFLVACGIRDIVRKFQQNHADFRTFSSKVAIQLNDTHPTLAVAELMRILVDENDLSWEEAWDISRATLAYTNHTLMPEALEKWPVSLFEYVLPRHLQIIYEINRRFLDTVAAAFPGDNDRLRRMSIIEEGERKQIRMAHLAIIGSHSVNGVSRIHTELIKSSLVPDFYQLWPERFSNKTNGITQRRWLLVANPLLAELISRTIGREWITNLDTLKSLEAYAEDEGFQQEFRAVKRSNKERLARIIKLTTRVTVDPGTLFDVQAKRIHAYKRQLLNVMRIIHEYFRVCDDGEEPKVARTYIFAGKAAPGYWFAKQIIKLINNVARVVNNDPRVKDRIKVVFIPDYRVSLAETIVPAADLSEQISTAGTEASGTGNMKFAMNGALTIGTLDGANIEMREEVGEENIFIFGLRADEIQQIRAKGGYGPREYYDSYPRLRRVIDSLDSDIFCQGEPGLFKSISGILLNERDEHFHLADLVSYLETQEKAGDEFMISTTWTRKAILNVARMGRFSSDRTIQEYARDVWNVGRV